MKRDENLISGKRFHGEQAVVLEFRLIPPCGSGKKRVPYQGKFSVKFIRPKEDKGKGRLEIKGLFLTAQSLSPALLSAPFW